jgi:hypothetical protein
MFVTAAGGDYVHNGPGSVAPTHYAVGYDITKNLIHDPICHPLLNRNCMVLVLGVVMFK